MLRTVFASQFLAANTVRHDSYPLAACLKRNERALMPLIGHPCAFDVQLASTRSSTGVNSMVNWRQFGLQQVSVSHVAQVGRSCRAGGTIMPRRWDDHAAQVERSCRAGGRGRLHLWTGLASWLKFLPCRQALGGVFTSPAKRPTSSN